MSSVRAMRQKPRFSRSAAMANEGVAALTKVVASHGSIFRETPQQTDVGIDGFIEPVFSEQSFGILVAVQVKSGDSYLNSAKDAFAIPVTAQHVNYWLSMPMPVLIICYSSSRDILSFTEVHDYVAHETYHERAVERIDVPITRPFCRTTLDDLTPLLRRYADQFRIADFFDQCFSDDADQRLSAVRTLSLHPATRDSRAAIFIMRSMLADPDSRVRLDALHHLGYCVARARWSWNPANRDERSITRFSAAVCRDLTMEEVRGLLSDVQGSLLYGPDSLLERLADVCHCASDTVLNFLDDTASNVSLPIEVRRNACWISRGASLDAMAEALREDDETAHELFGEVFAELFGDGTVSPD